MTASSRHNDVIIVKILSFCKNFTNQRRKVYRLSEFKKRQINGTKLKKNFLVNINNSILKKLTITKRVFSAKIQCTNVTLARKL